MITIFKLVEEFLQSVLSVSTLLGNNASSIDASLIFSKYYGSCPSADLNKWLENAPTENYYKFWSGTTKGISNLGYIPLSFAQIERDLFIKEDTARAAIKLLIKKGVCDSNIIKGSSNKYKMSISNLISNIDDEFLRYSKTKEISVYLNFWKNEEAVTFFKKLMLTFEDNNLHSGIRYLQYLTYLDNLNTDRFPSADKVHIDLGFNPSIIRRMSDNLTEKGVIVKKSLGGRMCSFTLNFNALTNLIDTTAYNVRENEFKRKIDTAICKNRNYKGGKKVSFSKVNSICDTPSILTYEAFSYPARIIIYKISKEAKKNGFNVNWNWPAVNILTNYITRRSKKEDQVEGLLENTNLECISESVRRMPKSSENWMNNFKNIYGDLILDYDIGIYNSVEEVLNDIQ